MMLSIIIPCFNGFKYMDKCFQHLENQTYKDFEVVVCDDCSTDNSFDLLQDYKSHTNLNIVLIKNEVNQGPGASRNNAIQNSHGELLMFCDCDDWYEDNALQVMIDTLIGNDADLVMCDNYYSTLSEKKQKRNATKNLIGVQDKKTQIAYARMSLCRLIVKKRLFDNLQIPNLYNGEDGAIVPLLLSRSTKSVFINDALYNYYVRDGSESTKPSPRIYDHLVISYQFVRNNLDESFSVECEFIGIKTVLYGAVFNAIKAELDKNVVYTILSDFTKQNPLWYKNYYYKSLSKSKKIFLFCLKNRLFYLLKIYTYLHIAFEKRMSVS